MRLIRKMSFVLIVILLISPGFARAQQNYIGEDEIVIEDIKYKNVETEFQRISNPNEGTAPVYLNQDLYPSLDGQTISPTVICEDASESKCISIINLQAIGIGEPVYGDLYEQTSLWQKIIYNGEIYYAPYDRLNFESVAQPVMPTQNPSSDYTGPTISAYEGGYFVTSSDENKDDIYVKPADTLGGSIYNWNIAHLNDGQEVDDPIYKTWYTLPFIPGLSKGIIETGDYWLGEKILGTAEYIWEQLPLMPDIPVVPITYVISDIPAVHKGSVEFTEGISGWIQQGAGEIDSAVTNREPDPIIQDPFTGASMMVNPRSVYNIVKAAAEWVTGTLEGLWGFYADPSDKITNIAYVIKDPGGVAAAHLHNVNKDLDGLINNYDYDKTLVNTVKVGLDILISPKLILGALGITGKSVIIADEILTADDISGPGSQARENKYNLSEELGVTAHLVGSGIQKVQNEISNSSKNTPPPFHPVESPVPLVSPEERYKINQQVNKDFYTGIDFIVDTAGSIANQVAEFGSDIFNTGKQIIEDFSNAISSVF